VLGAAARQALPLAGNLERCWTAERLAHRGLPHHAVCPLCDQAIKSIQHLLVECTFTRQI
jgi:hypothetical protein